MSPLQLTARLKIHEGALDAFKAIAAQCMRVVRERDSGTLQYDWFFNDDSTECVVREAYKDSASLLEHIANLGDTMGSILRVSDMTLEVFGAPSEELVQAAAGLAPKFYAPFQSI